MPQSTNLFLKIKNFKSIKESKIRLSSGLNILIGPNGTGKTCIFSAIKFLRDLFLRGSAQGIARAGGPNRAYHRGEDEINFSIVTDYGKRVVNRRKCPTELLWDVSVRQGGPDNIAYIAMEELTIVTKDQEKNNILFRITITRNPDLKLNRQIEFSNPNVFGRDLFSIWDYEFKTDSKSELKKKFITKFEKLADYLEENSDQSVISNIYPIDSLLKTVHQVICQTIEFNIIPDQARSSSEHLPFAYLRPDGSGLSELIYSLEKGYVHRIQNAPFDVAIEQPFISTVPGYRITSSIWINSPFRASIRERYKLAFEDIKNELSYGVQAIENISTSIDPTNGKRFIVFHTAEDKFYPEEVSDGTIKWLAILVSIYTRIEGLYLLEEPENFLHPWMQQRLIASMRQRGIDDGTIFLLSSHSVTVLNSSDPEEIRVVKHQDGGSVVTELPNREAIDAFLSESEFRLGDLWVSGMIEGVPGDE